MTSGAGFIGSHSVEALLASGARVRVLDNFSNGKRANLPGQHPLLEILEGDIRDASGNLLAHGTTTCLIFPA